MSQKKILVYLFVLSPLLFSFIQDGYSLTADSTCKEGYVLVLRTNVQKYACVFDSTASEWQTLDIAEPVEPMEQVPPEETEEEPVITNFKECAAAGNPVMESYPRQCTADGQTFVEEIEMQEPLGVFEDTMSYTENPVEIDQDKGYSVDEIAEGIYWLVGNGYQTMFVTTGEGVIAVDAPQPIGQNYLAAIGEVTSEPVTYMVYSHAHQDHTGVAGQLFPNATFVSHKQTADVLMSQNSTDQPVPTVTFDNDLYRLSLGNQTLELHYIGNFHSDGDIVIYAPAQKVAMAVDLMRPGETPYRAFGVTPDIDLYLQTHDNLVDNFDFDVLISGHTNLLATKDDIRTNKQFALDVMENARLAIQNGTANPEELCAEMTIQQWEGRLDNLDAFMIDHCGAMVQHVSSLEYTDPDQLFVTVPLDEDTTSDDVEVPVPDSDIQRRVENQLDLLAFKIEKMQELAKNPDIIRAVIDSNNRFAAMEEPAAYIAQKDQEWLKTPMNLPSPFMSAIIESNLSDLLREKSVIITDQFGDVLFPEIIITNAYGANVAQSIRTEDYNQADEGWWLRAKTVPIHFREVAWDASAEIFSSDIVIKLVDEDGNFIGVLNAATPIGEEWP
jgi:glyoxylase-like metal-dependent hydrolase (beta-lactamase superfamily II)